MATAAAKADDNVVVQLPTPWEKLRAPFPAERIGKLPKSTKRDNPKGKCPECSGWHGLPAVHLDYVGHADITDRLLDVDPEWTWEPVAWGDDGLPRFALNGGHPVGLWIRLTVAGVTRLGYGSVEGGAFEPEKQLIGDALRNAAMRFGVALDLWRKDETHASASTPATTDKPRWTRTATGRGCPETTCDGSLQLNVSPDGTQRFIGCSNWQQDKGGCKHREPAPPVPPVVQGEVNPRDAAIRRLVDLSKVSESEAQSVLWDSGWGGVQKSTDWIAGLSDEESVTLVENLDSAIAELDTEIPT